MKVTQIIIFQCGMLIIMVYPLNTKFFHCPLFMRLTKTGSIVYRLIDAILSENIFVNLLNLRLAFR